MKSFTSRSVEIDGVRTVVEEAGEGAPLVFLHPAGTVGGFDMLLPLAETRRLIVPFHPGFGGSDDDPRIDSLLDYVVHYGALFDELGLREPVDLVGHSFGGWIGSLLAILDPRRVKRLALAAPAGLQVPEHPTRDIFTIPREELAAAMFARPPAMPPLPVKVQNELFLQRYREMTSLARVAWHRAYEPKMRRWLRRVKQPVLLLWGDEDRIIPVQQARTWAESLGGPCETVTFTATGHQIFHDEPRAVAALGRFFAEGS